MDIADFDRDGNLDFIATTVNRNGGGTGQRNNHVFFNDGTGNFSRLRNAGFTTSSASSLGDLDGDDDIDIFIGNTSHAFSDFVDPLNILPNQVWLNDFFTP